ALIARITQKRWRRGGLTTRVAVVLARYDVTAILLLVAGFLGGALNSLAGGGSFIVFPALLWAGVPPVIANASNTFAALPGYLSGAYGFRKDIFKHRDRLVLYTVISLIFGYVGAELLLHVSDEQFN